MIKFRSELYTFVTHSDIEGTNNTAEREQRPAVLIRKISYCNRSESGAENQAILMSSIRTTEKRGQNFVETATQHLAQ
jgi:transposase